MRTVLLISSLVQFSPRDMNTGLGVRGGFAVHKCRTIDPPTHFESVAKHPVICSDCNRSFRRSQVAKRFTREIKTYF